jgi:hypothetical protein
VSVKRGCGFGSFVSFSNINHLFSLFSETKLASGIFSMNFQRVSHFPRNHQLIQTTENLSSLDFLYIIAGPPMVARQIKSGMRAGTTEVFVKMSMERYSFSTVVASLILNFIKLREQAKL